MKGFDARLVRCTRWSMGILFKTTATEADHLNTTIVPLMEAAGLDVGFIVEATTLALFDQAVYDLMALWVELPEDRDVIVKDIEDLLEENRRPQRFSTSTTLAETLAAGPAQQQRRKARRRPA